MTEKQVRKIAEYKAKNFKPNLGIVNYGLEDILIGRSFILTGI